MPQIKWITTRYKLRLRVLLNWKKYNENEGALVLPPEQLGRCKDWRFEIAQDENTAVFSAIWERRMIPSGADLDEITVAILPYIENSIFPK